MVFFLQKKFRLGGTKMKRILKNLSLTSMLFLSYSVMSFASTTNDELGIGAAAKKGISGLEGGLMLIIIAVSVVILLWKFLEGGLGQNDLGSYVKPVITMAIMLALASKSSVIVNLFAAGSTFEIIKSIT